MSLDIIQSIAHIDHSGKMKCVMSQHQHDLRAVKASSLKKARFVSFALKFSYCLVAHDWRGVNSWCKQNANASFYFDFPTFMSHFGFIGCAFHSHGPMSADPLNNAADRSEDRVRHLWRVQPFFKPGHHLNYKNSIAYLHIYQPWTREIICLVVSDHLSAL